MWKRKRKRMRRNKKRSTNRLTKNYRSLVTKKKLCKMILQSNEHRVR